MDRFRLDTIAKHRSLIGHCSPFAAPTIRAGIAFPCIHAVHARRVEFLLCHDDSYARVGSQEVLAQA